MQRDNQRIYLNNPKQGQPLKVLSGNSHFRIPQKAKPSVNQCAACSKATASLAGSRGAGKLPDFFSARYKLLQRIDGGRAVIFKAKDRELGMDVALKFLPRKLLRDARQMEDFKREATIAMRLTHDGIVRLYTLELKHAYPFIVMEFVNGETLRTILNKVGALSGESVTAIARELVQAVAYAHSHGVLHRDLKPENIMITQEGHLKVLDFGSAVNVGSTLDDYIDGTPGFMAPEQVSGAGCDSRVDVFAMGAIFWETVTGHAAFPNRNEIAHMYDRPPVGGAHLGDAIRQVLLKALSIERDLRWPSALAFGEALIAALQQEGENV